MLEENPTLVPHDMRPGFTPIALQGPTPGSSMTLPLLGTLVLILSVLHVVSPFNTDPRGAHVATPLEVPKEEASEVEQHTPVVHNPFEGIVLEAKSAVVWDVNARKVVYSKGENDQHPLASLSKLMTALVASENLSHDAVVYISKEDLLTDGDSGLVENEAWKLRDLLDFMLIVSSNDGSQALATALEAVENKNLQQGIQKTAFIDIMNRRARELRMYQTYFLNSSGLDVDEVTLSGSYGSAKDVTLLVDHMVRTKPELLEKTSLDSYTFTSKSNITHVADNTNTIIDELPGLIASKTGYTELAGGNLIIAFDAGLMQPYIITVLGSSKEGRFSDVRALHEATLEFLTQREAQAGTTPPLIKS